MGESQPAPTWAAERLSAAPGPVLMVVVALGYLALAQLMMLSNDPITNGASLWPAAGLSLAALMLVPTRRWGWVLGAVALAELAGDLAWGYPLPSSIGWTLSNTAEPLVGAFLLRKAGNTRGRLAPVPPLLKFLGCAVLAGPVVGATLGSLATAAAGASDVVAVWPKYFIGDALGVLVVAPLLLSARGSRSARSIREAAALVVSSIITAALVFTEVGGAAMVTMPYLMLPFFAWAALRFGTRGTAWMAVGVTTVADVATVSGVGPFAIAGGSQGSPLALLQIYLGITVSFALLLAAVVSELSDRRQLEAVLLHQASHDALTGLANRTALGEALEAACSEPPGPAGASGLLVCDLDGLKAVNDRVGHHGGDELLTLVAERLRTGVRPDDLVARISGDEFVVLLRNVDGDALRRVSQRILETVAQPALLGGKREVSPSVSIGGAVREPGESPESLFQVADAALYQAKRRGRGSVVLADEDLRVQARAQTRTEDSLPSAFDEGQLVCMYQPIVDVVDGRVCAVEAIVCWRHPELGLLDAERFLPAVERMGMADRLFETVLTQALEAQGRWVEQTGRRLTVSVNVSALQLGGGGVVNAVLRALAETDTPPDALCLEVTKQTPLDDLGVASLHQLHALGVCLVLDGFGSGWSSMTRLARIPWNVLKIDKSFVAELGSSSGSEDIVGAMIAMAGALDIGLGADGVSRVGQLDALAALGCRYAQGSLFSRPVTDDGVATMLTEHQTWPSEQLRAAAPEHRPVDA